jgi:transaldolase
MIKIFYDGLNIEKWESMVSGFTTNCTIFSTNTERNYKKLYESVCTIVKDRPFSLQIWKDDGIEQIKEIHSINPSIYVKIPVVNSKGEYNETLIRYAVEHSIPINVTCIYTFDHITRLRKTLNDSTAPEIISVFAGPISDTGIPPDDIVRYAIEAFADRPNAHILWAGCREVYTIQRAQLLGCHIITVPDSVMEKLTVKKDLDQLSIERVQLFQKHAIQGNLCIL